MSPRGTRDWPSATPSITVCTRARGCFIPSARLAARDAINHGMYEGPRLFQTVVDPGGRILKTPDEARARAKAILAMGADVLGAADGDAPPEVFAAYADEGHKAGKGVMMRCVGPQTRGKSCALAGA